jgi:phosphatidylserine/phosphatidylglycerophosphate/cardiolipin synthase-like enzyme
MPNPGLWRLLLAALVVALLSGCATALPDIQRTPSHALVAPPEAPLAAVAREAGVPAERSGFRPLQQAAYALDARLTLIRQAQTSLDLQYYLVGNDPTGRLILRELRDAAARGVRVRLLVDDLYTVGMDKLLLGLAAHPNVEVRLFNPFVSGRELATLRMLNFMGDFRRLNHRMHNKLFIADGVMAVAGGRNLADEYFLRSKEANFIDFDLLITGALVPQLSRWFDLYWNSELVYPIDTIASSGLSAAELRAAFEDKTAADGAIAPPAPVDPDLNGIAPFSTQLAQHDYRFIVADASSYADSPEKARPHDTRPNAGDTVTHRFVELLRGAKHDVLMFSPYFIPGEQGMKQLRAARDAGIEVSVFTNALATSDEPLVNVGYQRYRNEMLGMGVQLFELSSSRLKHDPLLRNAFGSSRGRLHAKMAFIDRKTVLVGSMNLDPRSAKTNTELGVAVRSPELAKLILDGFKIGNLSSVYQVQLKPDGSGVQWTARDENGVETLTNEPDASLWQRMRLFFLFLFVPEDLL